MSNNDFAILVLGIICLVDTIILTKHEWNRASREKRIRRVSYVHRIKR